MRQTLPLIVTMVCAISIGCASLGTHTEVVVPEAVRNLKSVSIWPIRVLPFVREVGELDSEFPGIVDTLLQDIGLKLQAVDLSRDAEDYLVSDLRATGLFNLIGPDSVWKLMVSQDTTIRRWQKHDWQRFGSLVHTDGIMLTDVSFDRESGGINTYVTLCVYEVSSSELMVTSKFNTKWGKSYFFPQSADKTMPDAISCAVKGLAKAMSKATSTH